MPTTGHIYILTNNADRTVVRVGRTNDLRRRLNEHNAASNVVGTWSTYWSLEVTDIDKAEVQALSSLEKWKVSGRRKQFRCDPTAAKNEVAIALAEWSNLGKRERYTLERSASVERKRRKRKMERAKQKSAERERLKREAKELEVLQRTFHEKKAAYEHAKRVLSGEEAVPWWQLWRRSMSTEECQEIIRNFEVNYPDGLPPKTIEDARLTGLVERTSRNTT